MTCGREEASGWQAAGRRLCSFLALLSGSVGANHVLCHESHFSKGKRVRFLPTLQGNCEANGAEGGETLQAGSCKDFRSQTGRCNPQPLITQLFFSIHRHLQSITQRTRHCQRIHCGSFLEMCCNYFSQIITPTVLIIMSSVGLSLRASVYGLCFILDGRSFSLSGYMFSFQPTEFVYPVYILIQRDLLIHASLRGLGACCPGSSWAHVPTLSF